MAARGHWLLQAGLGWDERGVRVRLLEEGPAVGQQNDQKPGKRMGHLSTGCKWDWSPTGMPGHMTCKDRDTCLKHLSVSF